MNLSPARRHTLILLALLAATLFAVREWRVAPDGDVTVHALYVGQGDSMFITGPSGQQVLIDGGPDNSALAGMGKRMSFFDRTIDLLVLTHPDTDHTFALPELLRRYRVQAALITGVNHSQPRYAEFLDLLRRQKIPVLVADPAKDINLGDGMLLDVLWPPPVYLGSDPPKEGSNNTSIVLRLTYGEDTMLFTGDMEEPEENALLASGADVRADILKVGHHGSKTSTSTGFLLAVDPRLALISAGKDNRFGHPHQVVLERLKRHDVPYRSTALEGTVSIDLDGRE